MKGGYTEGGMSHEILWTLGNKLRVSEGRGVGDGLAQWWVLRRGRIAWCTGCYTQVMNHGTLHQKLGMYCMVTNIVIIEISQADNDYYHMVSLIYGT